MVIAVLTLSSGISLNRVSMSSIESMATPTLPTSPVAIGSSESYPIWVGRANASERPVCPRPGRQVDRDGKSCLPLAEQVAVALVGFFGGTEAGVLAHRPEPAAIHGRLDTPGKRVFAAEAQFTGGVEALHGVRRVQGLGRGVT